MDSIYNIKVRNSDKRKGNLLCYKDNDVWKNYYNGEEEEFEEDEIIYIENKSDFIITDVVPTMDDNAILLTSICKRGEEFYDEMLDIRLNKTKLYLRVRKKDRVIPIRNVIITGILKYKNDFNTYLEVKYLNSGSQQQYIQAKINIWDINELGIIKF